MKGIILAGGYGTRLYPTTNAISKHLLPVYDKPMIYYSLATLMSAGIRDILVITMEKDISAYQALLGDGDKWGLSLTYEIQPGPGGIAQAFIIGEDFIANEPVCLILGDNIFYGHGLPKLLARTKEDLQDATVFAYQVKNPSAYGVIGFDGRGQPITIIEKPKSPASSFAVTGIYFYGPDVVDIAKSLTPSKRGELEITDINQYYLQKNQLRVEILPRGMMWLDAGTPQTLLEASHFVEVIETRQGMKIACLEEIAWRQGYITTESLRTLVEAMPTMEYKNYLQDLLSREDGVCLTVSRNDMIEA
jgi:glucose-1-phosphate thymidylyltransferase